MMFMLLAIILAAVAALAMMLSPFLGLGVFVVGILWLLSVDEILS
jgi:hypothetical protein